VDEIQKYKKK